MTTDPIIQKINRLAAIEKKRKLTKKEQKEQKELRNKYLENFRKSFRNQLESVRVVDAEGNDVTPEKVKKSQNNDNSHRS